MAFGKEQLMALKTVQQNAKKKGEDKTVPVIRAFAIWSVLHRSGKLTGKDVRDICDSKAKVDATLFQQVRKLLESVASKYGWPKDVPVPMPRGRKGGRARMTETAANLAAEVDVDSWIAEAESDLDDLEETETE